MEIYEKINALLKEKKIKKKELARIIINSNYHLKSTGEVPSEKTIYAYLCGKNSLRIELLPLIAEALNISVGELFPETDKSRLRCLEYILSDPKPQELKLIRHYLSEAQDEHSFKGNNHANTYKHVQSLLPYASEVFIKKLIDTLESFRDATQRGLREIH